MMPLPFLRGRPRNIGLLNGRLNACPSSPNCVSSDAVTARHAIDPLHLSIAPAAAWISAVTAVRTSVRTRIVTETPDYLHAECTSALFGFVDDLELHLRPDEHIIAVRSASRLGYADFGVNRSRVEKLRAMLREQGVAS
jgi:uncharacterized protein (DUF1499 family)